MLWYALARKGWLETRFRLLYSLGFAGFFLASAYFKGPPVKVVVGSGCTLVAVIAAMLAGAGITTQPALQAAKGLHGSMLFTLSLPVSRLRLPAVRASLGWLELAGVVGMWCCGMWILLPILRSTTTGVEMFEYAGALVVCASGLYSITVLLATFLDDLWRFWGSAIAFGALSWLSDHTPLPASANIFRAMGEGSPVLAHTMPWTAMVFSLALAAILFFSALRIAQVREY